MLQYSTVEPTTLVLLKELLGISELKDFYLVGGTNLSLRYGHRISIDLDLFSNIDFSPNEISEVLFKKYRNENDFIRATTIGVFASIKGVKVDLIRNHFHPIIDPTEITDGIRLYSSKDIAAMKIQALLNRGAKKDFFDLYELLQHFSLQEIIDFYRKKYPKQILPIAIPQVLTYFEDAEESEDPISLKNLSWEQIKKGLQKKVNDYLR
jgi:hypothetical protein